MNKCLPIFYRREEIINAVNKNDIVIITAETGSGKSTQVPQYLYSQGYDVIVTEPRRIAAVSLANRVSEELGNREVVAYHTAFESTRTSNTKILFCTDGLQMAKGIDCKMAENTVLVIDEVHEWNLNIETLIAWIKMFKQNGSKLKVVLMSATLDQERLAYFYSDVANVKSINVENKNFNVENTYLDAEKFISSIAYAVNSGQNVLAFVQGKKEIADTIDELSNLDLNAVILPMHGELEISEQNKCFEIYSLPKVVVATNIAQTSITISDIDVVIDLGLEKRVECIDGIEGLFEHNISKADCIQRAGRAGRTKNGEYFLCSNYPYEFRSEFSEPEIERLILDKVVLKLASIGIDAEKLEFFHQPSMQAIVEAKKTLTLLGALENNQITDMGNDMVRIPVSVRFSRMLIEANKLGVVDDVITIVSILENGSLVNFNKAITMESSFSGYFKTNTSYSCFTDERQSDLLAELNIYNQIISYKYKNLKEAGINSKSFFKIKEFRSKLEKSLESIVTFGSTGNRSDIIKSCLYGLLDNVYESRYYNDLCDGRGNWLKLNKNSCIGSLDYSNFVLGIPFSIEVSTEYGKQKINLLQMATTISKSYLAILLDEKMIDKEYLYEDIYFDNKDQSFVLPFHTKYTNLIIEKSYLSIFKGDDMYDELMKKFSNIVEKENDKLISINGHIVEVMEDYSRDLYIDLTIEDLFSIDSSCLKTKGGKDIYVYCMGERGTNLSLMKERLAARNLKDLEMKLTSSLPKKTGKLETIIDFFKELKEVEIKNEYFSKKKYLGLIKDRGSIGIEAFDEKATCDESTLECLQYLVMREVNEKYNDKKFCRKIDGKRTETKVTIKAKEEFKNYVSMALDDIDITNFVERILFLDEVFNELTVDFI